MYHRPRLIPCLLLSDGGLVKTVRFKDPNYLGDPINAVKIFSEKCVDELCVQDIQASREGRGPDFALLEDLASEAFMPLSYGGGVTTVEQAARLFHIGFEKVILNTALIDRPELVRELADRFGSQSVVASIDVKLDRLRRYRCVVAGGTRPTGRNAAGAGPARAGAGRGRGAAQLRGPRRHDAGLRPQAGPVRRRRADRAAHRLRGRAGRGRPGARASRGTRPRGSGGKPVCVLRAAESGAHQRALRGGAVPAGGLPAAIGRPAFFRRAAVRPPMRFPTAWAFLLCERSSA